MDYGVFANKNVNSRNRSDRFVFPRDYISEVFQRPRHSRPLEHCQSIGDRLKNLKYTNYVDKTLGVAHRDSLKPEVERWPCIPRKKTYLSSVHSILDLPRYSDAVFPELLDWSKDNILVAALGNYYHKLSLSSQSIVSRVFTRHEIQCCKFDPRGELLLLGTNLRRVEIHNNACNKKENEVICPCYVKGQEPFICCSVTTVDWSPTGNSFVIGCALGVVSSLTRSARVIACYRTHLGPVLLARVSPDARYVAVCSVNRNCVLLLTWPDLVFNSRMVSDCLIKTFSWHPWRSALLGVGAMNVSLSASLALWNAPTKEVRETSLGPAKYGLDAMLFSERTGELVASLWNSGDSFYHKTYSQLVVLSDSQTVVDQWGAGLSWSDSVRTMVFNPDGTKLATATMDEDLIIWNFLPEDKVKKNTKRKRFSAMAVYQDKAAQGFSIR
ncbi:protein cortex [Bicyclus anynana]|uniref:Protein cortex n=1 Tax=Bicyclus anynana TaxID=110368 RepID=A0A6J1MI57_BICAN|nr:protein cortex [Bicyclus anynana]